ncbi:MAG TPA: PIG-L deacetylase family protein [Candidatus Angelobacter sp.]|nr:PIG-L deacetylase family protein [Candidatus Angelobacter sp.]
MNIPVFPRRDFVKQSVVLATPTLLAAALPLGAAEFDSGVARKLKVVCVGGHPDDPESGCAGTLARYSEQGHAVSVIYLTRGERGIQGKSLDEAAKIRTAECEAACKIIGAKAVFAGQIDGTADFTRTRVDELQKLLAAEAPDLVFTHWPVDTHMDHQVASMCAIRACMALPRKPHLYFFEVNSGSQTQGFAPNTYVDITPVLEKKKSALFAHASQDGQGIWKQHHEFIAQWRGREAGVAAAEAFSHLNRDNKSTRLPGV